MVAARPAWMLAVALCLALTLAGAPAAAQSSSSGSTAPGDQDKDGRPDSSDNCPAVANASQADSDGDGAGNACDACPGQNDRADADADGKPDACDPNDTDGPAGDPDGDGIRNSEDKCLGGDDDADADGDGKADACDPDDRDGPKGDSDGDTVLNPQDRCAESDDRLDGDGDSLPDGCDPALEDGPKGDLDGDGKANDVDNCRSVANPAQADADGDKAGDACDTQPNDGPLGDADGDTVANASDRCAGHDDRLDLDADRVPDACDPDDDGDRVSDALEQRRGTDPADPADYPLPPPAPWQVTVVAAPTGNQVFWPAVESAAGYVVWRGSSPYAVVARLPAGTTSYVDATVQDGAAYRYRVTSFDSDGIGNASVAEHVHGFALAPEAGPQTFVLDSDGDGVRDTLDSDPKHAPAVDAEPATGEPLIDRRLGWGLAALAAAGIVAFVLLLWPRKPSKGSVTIVDGPAGGATESAPSPDGKPPAQ